MSSASNFNFQVLKMIDVIDKGNFVKVSMYFFI